MSHSLSSILLHLVFSTKYRKPIIEPTIEPELYNYIGKIVEKCGCRLIAIGGYTDHIHILFSMSRSSTVSDVVRQIKTGSTKWLKWKDPRYRDFKWQNGYGVFSIGESGVPNVRRYIARQKEHHKTKSFEGEYRAICNKYNINTDEKSVWD